MSYREVYGYGPNKALPITALTFSAIQGEALSAVLKHDNHTPLNPSLSHKDCLVIVAEEFGEVARAMTYDEGDSLKLERELIQLATMVVMWIEGGMRREPEQG